MFVHNFSIFCSYKISNLNNYAYLQKCGLNYKYTDTKRILQQKEKREGPASYSCVPPFMPSETHH